MKIEVVETNVNEVHPSILAWNNSRPDNTPIPLDEILQLDLPVNEIPMATLFIESTILEREIIVSARNHVMWAQTSRVQNVLEFTYPKELPLECKQYYERQRNRMEKAQSMGMRQDEYRKILPVMANTKYTVNMSMRDLVKLLKYFESLSKEYSHLSPVLDNSVSAIKELLGNVFGFEYRHTNEYKTKSLLQPIMTPQDGLVGNVLSLTARLPLSLRAQLARHRQLIIEDNLVALMSSDTILFQDNEMPVDICVTGLQQDWRDVLTKRSCWIAHYNLWSPLLNKVEKYLHLGESALPCYFSGKCPYDGDAKARYTDEDPNAPCPIHARLYKKSVTTDQLNQMYFQQAADERPEFWADEIAGFNNGEA